MIDPDDKLMVMNSKLYDLFSKIVSRITILILGILTFFSLISTTFVNDFDEVYYTGDLGLIHAFSCIVLFLLILLLHSRFRFRITDRTLVVFLLIMTLLTGVFLALTNLQPRFDQREIRAVAGNLSVGITDDYLPGGYAEIYPYQNTLILFYEMIIRIAGFERYIVIQYFNLFCIVLTEAALFLILKRVTPYFREIMLGVILFIPYWGFAGFLYGIVPGFCLGMWGVYFSLSFLQEPKMIRAVFAGLFMAVACRFKLNYTILLFAAVILIVMETIKSLKPVQLLLILSMVLFFILSGSLIDLAVKSQIDHPLTDGIPGIASMAMGLHENEHRGAGWHDNYPENTYQKTGYDAFKTAELSKEDILASIRNFKEHPVYMAGFFIRKTASMWNEPTYYSWVSQQGRDEALDKKIFFPGIPFVTGSMNILQTFLYLFALLYFILHRNDTDFIRLFFALHFLGGFFFHILWEAQSQYALTYAFSLVPYSTVGMIEAYRRILALDRKKKLYLIVTILAAGLILSVPAVSSFLTLNRDNLRYAEYIKAPY